MLSLLTWIIVDKYSCFLLSMSDDSIEGIYDPLKLCALISNRAWGVGLNVYCIRAAGAFIVGVSVTVMLEKLYTKQ